MPKKGDVVLTTEAPLGEIAQLDGRKVALAQRLITLRGKSGVLDNDYLKFLMLSTSVQEQLHGRASGTTVLGIKQSELRKLQLNLPPFIDQQKVAGVLSSLDRKIELNRQMNATLEATARALFKSWFVDFDPVRAKMEGRAPDGLSADIAALFPDTLVDSPLGEIPKGWEIDKFSRIANQTKTTVNPSLFPEEEFLHFSLPAYDTYQQPVLQFGTEIKSNKTPVSSQHVLLSKLNPETPRVWFVPNLLGQRSLCSTEFLAYSPTEHFCREYLYCLFVDPMFRATLEGMVTGTSKSHQRVQPKALPTTLTDQSLENDFSWIGRNPGLFYKRYIDDYQCYAKTREQAEEFVRKLRMRLSEFGLHLNTKKTHIYELPDTSENSWMGEIQSALPRSAMASFLDAKRFLDYIVVLAKKYPSKSIIKYGLKCILKTPPQKTEEREAYSKILGYALNLAFHYPAIIPTLSVAFTYPQIIRNTSRLIIVAPAIMLHAPLQFCDPRLGINRFNESRFGGAVDKVGNVAQSAYDRLSIGKRFIFKQVFLDYHFLALSPISGAKNFFVLIDPYSRTQRMSAACLSVGSFFFTRSKIALVSSASASRLLSISTSKNSVLRQLGKRGFIRNSNTLPPSSNCPWRL